MPKLLMGIFGAAQGLTGEVRLQSYCENPLDINQYGALTSDTGKVFELTHLRTTKNMLVARVKGISDRTAAEQLTNIALYIDRALLGEASDEDEYFHADLVGLNVMDENHERLGTVLALFNFGAGDMLEIRPVTSGKSVMLPFTKAAVPSINIIEQNIIVSSEAYEIAKDDKPDLLSKD